MEGINKAADLRERGKAAKLARRERENKATEMIKSQYGEEKTGVVEISESEAEALGKQSAAEKIYQKKVHVALINILKGDRGNASKENVKELRTVLYDSVKDAHKGAAPEALDYGVDSQLKQILDSELAVAKSHGDLESKKGVLDNMVTKMKSALEEEMYPGYVRINKDIEEELNKPE